MKYTKLPTNTFQQIQINAGVIASTFNASTGALTQSDIIGATSGGINFTATPTFNDMGEDIDNCPKNTKELKQIESWEAKMTGTFVTVTTSVAQKLLGAATVATNKVTPKADLATSDFADLWFVGDYSDKTGDQNGGFVAIHLINALSTGGFQLQTTDRSKGQFEFEFTAHYSTSDTTVPFEIYIKAGTAEPNS